MHSYKCLGKITECRQDKECIKEELYENGPLETGFAVFSSFMNYKSGIYQYKDGIIQGGHAVKIIGFGHDDTSGLDYWICANSWGPDWGESGFFRIAWGECNIDYSVLACIPDVQESAADFLQF